TQPPDACVTGGDFFKSASTPASDPLVTGVGGTTLFADDPDVSHDGYLRERAWSDRFSAGCDTPDTGCSGGGFSTLFARPGYQASLIGNAKNARGVPDVAYNAGLDGGVMTHYGVGNLLFGLDPTNPFVFFVFGGAGAGAPQGSA